MRAGSEQVLQKAPNALGGKTVEALHPALSDVGLQRGEVVNQVQFNIRHIERLDVEGIQQFKQRESGCAGLGCYLLIGGIHLFVHPSLLGLSRCWADIRHCSFGCPLVCGAEVHEP